MWTMERLNQLSLKTENTFEAAQEEVKKPSRGFAFITIFGWRNLLLWQPTPATLWRRAIYFTAVVDGP